MQSIKGVFPVKLSDSAKNAADYLDSSKITHKHRIQLPSRVELDALSKINNAKNPAPVMISE